MAMYAILMRGINVGGKNKIPMSELKACLEHEGFERVITYIQSGNMVLQSNLDAKTLGAGIENTLTKNFTLDSSLVRVLALEQEVFSDIVAGAPKEFGKDLGQYRYDVIFLMGVSASEAMEQIDVHEGIDEAWKGNEVIYYRRPSLTNPNATKSHLGKIAQKPLYQAITIRNWNTTIKLLDLITKQSAG